MGEAGVEINVHSANSADTNANVHTEGEDDDITKRELDDIQQDLDDLLFNLDNFIQENESEFEDDDINDDDLCKSEILKDYITEGDSPTINWHNLGPFVQNLVIDLNRLRCLNNQTNQVVKRIRKITTESLLNSGVVFDSLNNHKSPIAHHQPKK